MYILTFNPNKTDLIEIANLHEYIKEKTNDEVLTIPDMIHLTEYDIDELQTIQKALNDYIDFLIKKKEATNDL